MADDGFGREDSTLGGRVGVFRYGNTNTTDPQGWQMDLEGAANSLCACCLTASTDCSRGPVNRILL